MVDVTWYHLMLRWLCCKVKLHAEMLYSLALTAAAWQGGAVTNIYLTYSRHHSRLHFTS
jgi:hypothetical protein